MASTDNSLGAFNKEVWAAEMQQIFYKELVALAVANTELRAQLKDGDKVNKPYRSPLAPVAYVRGTGVTIQGITATNEYLDVGTFKTVPFYVDDIDAMQNSYPTMQRYAGDVQRILNNVLDQAVAGQVTNAGNYIDDGDVGGTAGNYITPTTSNIQQIFTAVGRKMDGNRVPTAGRYAMVGPRLMELVRLYIGGKDTAMADVVGANGKVMDRFGFELYYSNNIYWSALLTLDDNTSITGNTVSIAGVTWTYAAVPDTAGEIDVGTDAETSHDNLIAALNDAGTEDTTYVEVSDTDRRKLVLAGISAADTSATTITITGYGDIATAETFTADTNVFTLRYSRPQFGLKGFSVDLLTQLEPDLSFREVDNMRGINCLPLLIYGVKTFADGAETMVDVRLNAAAWSN